MSFHLGRGFILALALAAEAAAAAPQTTGVPPLPVLTADQIADQMQRYSRERSEKLKHLKSTRHYSVEYKGLADLKAQMEVEYTYDAASGKSFRILSQSGSKLLCDKVLKRAIDSEKEASQDKASTALTAANYKFELVGVESLAGRQAYVLKVQPVTASKFLYRGKIWVDAAEFALLKLEVEPAKNPSFWISRTLIHQSFAKTGDFWLPAQNRSETKVRLGGTAILTVDYGSYQIESSAAHSADDSEWCRLAAKPAISTNGTALQCGHS